MERSDLGEEKLKGNQSTKSLYKLFPLKFFLFLFLFFFLVSLFVCLFDYASPELWDL